MTQLSQLFGGVAVGQKTKLLHMRDEKANGTQGGTFTSGSWYTRDLNTVVTNEINGASLSSNQFTLPAGDYVTLGGLINHRLGRIAEVGDLVHLEGADLKVLEMDSRRITKVMFEYLVTEDPEEEQQTEESGSKPTVVSLSTKQTGKDAKNQPAKQTNNQADQNVSA